MRFASLALLGCIALAQAQARPPATGPSPHAAGSPAAPAMGVSPSTAQRIVWSCQLGALGNTAIMVNFVDRTALSTRAAAVGKATIDGDKVRWQETEPDGTLQYLLDRRTGEMKVTQVPTKGKAIVHTGRCAPPDRTKKDAPHG